MPPCSEPAWQQASIWDALPVSAPGCGHSHSPRSTPRRAQRPAPGEAPLLRDAAEACAASHRIPPHPTAPAPAWGQSPFLPPGLAEERDSHCPAQLRTKALQWAASLRCSELYAHAVRL